MSWLSKELEDLKRYVRGLSQSKKHVLRLQIKPSDPLIVDRWLDVAYVALWFTYGLWGVTTLILGLPTIQQFTPQWYQTAWSGAIGLLAITASLLAALIFFETKWIRQITKKTLERAIDGILCTFLGIYPLLLILRSIDGDFARTAGLSVLILSFLIFPLLRIHILTKRIKALREVQKNATGANRVL